MEAATPGKVGGGMQGGKGQAIVIGAGIVGACSALALQNQGWAVTLIDPEPPGSACSFGNAGLLAPSVLPLASPQTLRLLPRVLIGRGGPVSLRWPSAVQILPWFRHFLAASTAARFRDGAAVLHRLCAEAQDAYAQLLGDDFAALVRPGGYLVVYESDGAFHAAGETAALRRALGAEIEVLDSQAVRAIAPRLAGVRGALLLKAGAHVLDSQGLVQRVVARFIAAGGQVKHAKVSDIVPGDGVAVVLDDGTRARASLVVIAAGLGTLLLARKLGQSLPITAERGYHAMLKPLAVPLKIPVMSGEGAFVLTPMSGGIRLAGMSEFATAAAAPRFGILDAALDHARRLLPELDTQPVSRWMGSRPSSADFVPIIGRMARDRRIIVAAGHGHAGLTFGAVTAKLVAGLADGGPEDPALSPQRF